MAAAAEVAAAAGAEVPRTVNVALSLPAFSASSTARTSKECGPVASVSVMCGDVQGRKAASGRGSIAHPKLAVASSEENSNVGVVSVVGSGGSESIVTVGAVESST